MDLTKVGKLPTIAQRLASAEKELGYLSAFLVTIREAWAEPPKVKPRSKRGQRVRRWR